MEVFSNKIVFMLNKPFRIALLSVLALSLEAFYFPAYNYSVNGMLTFATPFDHKLSTAGFFHFFHSNLYAPHNFAEEASLEALFHKARSFRYVREKRGDNWQSPEETERRASGDCEDKALWLYSGLKEKGYMNVRLVVGKYKSFYSQFHVWVVYTDDDGDAFLLDPATQKRIFKTTDLASNFYTPVYSYDGENRYKHLKI